ncbi:malonate decarboxylase holo-ACP synthase [Mycobacterium sp. 050134]|uniref:malonate decarboxylase holo-ACP synthase n=1 Tax=Mycobacterium sp. 050134 TaxID=3096111 RepID=UPI002EDB3454
MDIAGATHTVRAHDLLRLKRPDQLAGDAPPWARQSLVRAPWAVVRRAVAPNDHIAVGVRGCTRGKRWGTTTAATNVVELLTPEQLVDRVDRIRSQVPAARALVELRRRLRNLPLQWGPTGSAGFELATGLATLGPDSDLDIVIRGRPPQHLFDRLPNVLDDLPARVDAQLDLEIGAVALAEVFCGAREVLVKTPTGIFLVSTKSLVAGR